VKRGAVRSLVGELPWLRKAVLCQTGVRIEVLESHAEKVRRK